VVLDVGTQNLPTLLIDEAQNVPPSPEAHGLALDLKAYKHTSLIRPEPT